MKEEQNEWENGEVPEIVKEEGDDKPAGRGVLWAIIIAVIVLALIYFLFFKEGTPTMP